MTLNALRGRGITAPEIPAEGETGRVMNTPASLADDVYVILDDFSVDQQVGPVLGWRTAPEALWPAQNSKCLITQPLGGTRDYWFVGWEPS